MSLMELTGDQPLNRPSFDQPDRALPFAKYLNGGDGGGLLGALGGAVAGGEHGGLMGLGRDILLATKPGRAVQRVRQNRTAQRQAQELAQIQAQQAAEDAKWGAIVPLAVAGFEAYRNGNNTDQVRQLLYTDENMAHLKRAGWTPEEIMAFDPTYENIRVLMADDIGTDKILDYMDKDTQRRIAMTEAATDQYSAETTRELGRGNLGLGQDKLAETSRSNRASEALQRMRAEQANNAAGDYGLTPVYGVDQNGNRVLLQANRAGGVRAAELPEGVTLEDDFYKSQQRELGKGRAKTELGRTKAGASLQTAMLKRDRMKEDLQLAIDTSNRVNTGVVGGRLRITGGQQDFDSLLDSIKARIGFEELQTMRDNSPTGGALGQVTEREIAFLQALMGSIDRLQTEGRLDANLARIMQDIDASYERIENAYSQDYDSGLFDRELGGSQQNSPVQPQTGSSTGALTPAEQRELEQLRRKYGQQ